MSQRLDWPGLCRDDGWDLCARSRSGRRDRGGRGRGRRDQKEPRRVVESGAGARGRVQGRSGPRLSAYAVPHASGLSRSRLLPCPRGPHLSDEHHDVPSIFRQPSVEEATRESFGALFFELSADHRARFGSFWSKRAFQPLSQLCFYQLSPAAEVSLWSSAGSVL